uniref:ascorbate ferrireductase (transmembrane) n=1 Tax=Anopheles albimanus TaxID=7167 RepID=A0A182F542_ANOAL
MDELEHVSPTGRKYSSVIGYIQSTLSYALFNIVHPFVIITSSACLLIACWKYGLSHLYSWHVLLTGLAYHLLMASGIVVLNGNNSLTRLKRHSTRRMIHLVLQCVASGAVLAGCVLQYVSREIKGKPHLVSVHSVTGTISAIFVITTLVIGLIILLSGQGQDSCMRPSLSKRLHRISGLTSFLAGTIAVVLSYNKHTFTEHFSTEICFMLKCFAVTNALLSLFGMLRNMYQFILEWFEFAMGNPDGSSSRR